VLQEKGNRLFAIGDTKKAEPRTGFIERVLEQICFCVLIFYVKDEALGCSIYRRWINPHVYIQSDFRRSLATFKQTLLRAQSSGCLD
jgi:hypothetical protein